MTDAVLIRGERGDRGTRGALLGPGGLRLHTMEPPWRGNRRNVSCIPPGAYTVVPHVSPRFGRCLAVARVPGRSHILFHAGNTAAHTRGCVLPGMRRGRLGGVPAVLASRTAMRALLAAAGGRPFSLEIVDA